LECLSRMMGNYHVRFLGESGAAMPRPYPVFEIERSSLQSWKCGGSLQQILGNDKSVVTHMRRVRDKDETLRENWSSRS